MLVCHVFLNVPHRRKKELEAAMRASSIQQEGVWPPAPTTYQQPEEQEIWGWCLQCRRVTSFTELELNGGRCMYSDCNVGIDQIVSWHDILLHFPNLPEQPEPGFVYADIAINQNSETTDASAVEAVNL